MDLLSCQKYLDVALSNDKVSLELSLTVSIEYYSHNSQCLVNFISCKMPINILNSDSDISNVQSARSIVNVLYSFWNWLNYSIIPGNEVFCLIK